MKRLFVRNNNNQEVSFKETFEKSGIPIIPIYNNNNNLNFILDSGSTTCLVNESVLPLLKDVKFLEKEDLILGLEDANGMRSKVCEFEFNLGDEVLKQNFRMINLDTTFNAFNEEVGIIVHGLLGSDFLNSNNYILDYNKMTIHH